MVSSCSENHNPLFFSQVCASVSSKNVCKKQAVTRHFADFIVRENKRFFLLLLRQQTVKSAAEFFAYVLTGKQSTNQRKKIQGCDFLLNRRPHAKIQLIWKKKNTHTLKFDIEWLCCDVFKFTAFLILPSLALCLKSKSFCQIHCFHQICHFPDTPLFSSLPQIQVFLVKFLSNRQILCFQQIRRFPGTPLFSSPSQI